MTFEPKDWITLCTAIAAFCMALATFLQRARADRLALRQQFTDLIEKLTNLNTEQAKYHALPAEERAKLPDNLPRLVNDQRRFLARQALFASQSLGELVSPYEHMVLATSFEAVDDDSTADELYRRAIDRAHASIDKCIVLRTYARFLFTQSDLEAGRKFYEKAIEILRGAITDRGVVYRADSYERWAKSELEWGNIEQAIECFRRARSEYSALKNPGRREKEVRRVSEMIPTPTLGRPAIQPVQPSASPRTTGA